MAITIHHATRLDHLALGLGELLGAEPPGPFEMELVALPTRGAQRWLDQRLSHYLGTGAASGRARGGISAGIDYRSPRSLVELFVIDDDDPWQPDLLAWQVLAVVDDNAGQEWLRPLATHLGIGVHGCSDPDRANRRYRVARRIAELFAVYASERPEMLRAWLAGEESGTAQPPPDLRWQVPLFVELAAKLGALPAPLRAGEALEAARRGGHGRLHLFGHTRLTNPDVAFLAQLSAHTHVHLWFPHPSPALWDSLTDPPADETVPGQAVPGQMVPGQALPRSEVSADAAVNPLLRSLGRESRELALRLQPLAAEADHRWHESDGEPPASTLLQQLQSDIRGNREPAPPARHRESDGSVQVHGCPSKSRQVEVLREVLTGLFEDDPGLEPRDVLILCPDVEEYAPLLQAAFGSLPGAGHPGHHLRARIADRAPIATNPLFDLAERLVGFVGGRVRSSELLDLLHREEVRRRFGFTSADIEDASAWIGEAGIRWGFTARHREAFQVPTSQNTVDAGLARLLLGVTVPDGTTVGGTFPQEVESTQIELLGALTELLHRLQSGVDRLESAQTVEAWVEGLTDLIHAIARPEHEWQLSAFTRALTRTARAEAAPATVTDFREILHELARPRASTANLSTGAITVATLVPMRSIPHKVVCLIGMDDGDFPRAPAFDGDDVLRRVPLLGEREIRIEDRQLFLDALMSATQTLIITYSRSGENRGEERYPAIPVVELLDAMAQTTGAGIETFITEHPLHPFDRRYFSGEGALASFDTAAAFAATARAAPTPCPPLLSGPVPAVERPEVSLRELHRFFADPVAAFIRGRLETHVGAEHDPPEDRIPVSLTPLQSWKIGDRLLTRERERGLDDAYLTAELLRGELPPASLGRQHLDDLTDRATELAQIAETYCSGRPAHTQEVCVDVGGTRIIGRVRHVYGHRIVRVSYSNLAAKHRFRAWLDLLTLALHDPTQVWEAIVIGRDGKKTKETHLRAPARAQAQTYLAELLDIYTRGMCEPLPLPPVTSAKWAEEIHRLDIDASPARLAQVKSRVAGEWETTSTWEKEDRDPYQLLAWGRQLSFEELLSMPPAPQESWNSQSSRLGQYAIRMWEPLLNHEGI